MAMMEGNCSSANTLSASSDAAVRQLDEDELTKSSNGSESSKSQRSQAKASPKSTACHLDNSSGKVKTRIRRKIPDNVAGRNKIIDDVTVLSNTSTESSSSSKSKTLDLLTKLSPESQSGICKNSDEVALNHSRAESSELRKKLRSSPTTKLSAENRNTLTTSTRSRPKKSINSDEDFSMNETNIVDSNEQRNSKSSASYTQAKRHSPGEAAVMTEISSESSISKQKKTLDLLNGLTSNSASNAQTKCHSTEEATAMTHSSSGLSNSKQKKTLDLLNGLASNSRSGSCNHDGNETIVTHTTTESEELLSKLCAKPARKPRPDVDKQPNQRLGKPRLRECKSDDLIMMDNQDDGPRRRGVRRSDRRHSLEALVLKNENSGDDNLQNKATKPKDIGDAKNSVGNSERQGLKLPQRSNVWALDAKLNGDSKKFPRRHSFASMESNSVKDDDTFATTSGVELKCSPEPPKKVFSRRHSVEFSSANNLDLPPASPSRNRSGLSRGSTLEKLNRPKPSNQYPASPFSIHDDKKKKKIQIPFTTEQLPPSQKRTSRRHSIEYNSRPTSKEEEVTEVKIEYKLPKLRSSRRHSALPSASENSISNRVRNKDPSVRVLPSTSENYISSRVRNNDLSVQGRRNSAVSTTNFNTIVEKDMNIRNKPRRQDARRRHSAVSSTSSASDSKDVNTIGLTKTINDTIKLPAMDMSDNPRHSKTSRESNDSIPRRPTKADSKMNNNDITTLWSRNETHYNDKKGDDLLGRPWKKTEPETVPRSPIRNTRLGNKIQMITKSPDICNSTSLEEILWKRTSDASDSQNVRFFNRRSSCPGHGDMSEIQEKNLTGKLHGSFTTSFNTSKNLESMPWKPVRSNDVMPIVPMKSNDDDTKRIMDEMYENFVSSTTSTGKDNKISSISERSKKSDRLNEYLSGSMNSLNLNDISLSKRSDRMRSLASINTSSLSKKKNTLNKFQQDRRGMGTSSNMGSSSNMNTYALPFIKSKNDSQIICRNDFDGSISSMSDCMSTGSYNNKK